MGQSYFILEIKGVIDNRFGNCVALFANPITENSWGTMSFNPYKNRDTKVFFFPDESHIIQPLIRLARSQRPWEPRMSDFREERIFDENKGERYSIYRHCSFNDDSVSPVANNVNVVAVSTTKSAQLQQNYLAYMREHYLFDPIDMQTYVSRLADESPDFFAWLFDDSSLKGYSLYELGEEYREAWRVFYDALDSL